MWRLPPAPVTLALKDCKVLRGNLVSLVTQVYLVHLANPVTRVTLVAQGHLVNLGQGLMPSTPHASVEAMIEVVHGE